MARLLFNAETDLDEHWVSVVPRNGKMFALFAYN
jgi:hypothetical protein